jgi:hypothetical protein
VRRKSRSRGAGVPEELARFVPADWPDADCIHDALEDWRHACLEWVKEHPGALPIGEFGDAVDVLRADMAYENAMPPCPKRYRPAMHNGVYLEPLIVRECPHKPV